MGLGWSIIIGFVGVSLLSLIYEIITAPTYPDDWEN